jgi:ribonuclease-3
MEEFEKILGYIFTNKNLLKTALTHSSFANESGGKSESYERLEFLGDSVLGMITSEYIFERFPNFPEGDLTQLRSSLVCEKTLKSFSEELKAGDFLFLSKGENKGGGRHKDSILADVFEAIVAAVFLDGGLECAKKIVLHFISKQLARCDEPLRDYKTEIQERIQSENLGVASYVVTDEKGPDHNKSFTVELKINEKRVGEGTAKSKKEAEQLAAKEAFNFLSFK